jgi:Cu2+-exporting ATPase
MVPGVQRSSVNWNRQTVRVEWDRQTVKLSRIARTLSQLGYRPGLVNAHSQATRRQEENRRQLIRIGVAGAAAGNNMLIAAALYIGMFQHITSDIQTLLRVASCMIGLISLLGPGRVFISGAVAAMRTRTPHMDLPIAVALLVGTVTGLINTLRGTGDIYFDSLSVLVFLLLLGRWIQFRQQNRAADSVELLFKLTPARARRLAAGSIEDVSVDALKVGDRIEVRPGDLVPVDGWVDSGLSFVNEQILSGEAAPVEKSRGDSVLAGTANLNGLLQVVTTKTGTATRIGRIARLVQEASETRPKIVEWANRTGGWFVLVVLVLALTTLAGWWLVRPAVAVDHMVAVLVVACPCALALATPLAISVAIGRLANAGILVKSGDVLQQLNRPGMIWIDKTGTLTEGKMRVVRWEGPSRWIPLVAAVEARFLHPFATALAEMPFDDDPDLPEPEVADVRSLPGGVTARVNGEVVIIGNLRLLRSLQAQIADRFHEAGKKFLGEKLSPCWIAVNGKVVSVAGLGDSIRADSADALQQLARLGWKAGILSGDHPDVVMETARQLKFPFEAVTGSASPEQKLETVRRGGNGSAPIVMIGDGVNDSAALASATVGIAVHGGAEASLAAAPVYLGKPGLAPILSLLEASRSTCRIIRLNLLVSIIYNGMGVGLAMAGLVNPLVAALLMPLSSITVTGLSLRAGRFREALTPDSL